MATPDNDTKRARDSPSSDIDTPQPKKMKSLSQPHLPHSANPQAMNVAQSLNPQPAGLAHPVSPTSVNLAPIVNPVQSVNVLPTPQPTGLVVARISNARMIRAQGRLDQLIFDHDQIQMELKAASLTDDDMLLSDSVRTPDNMVGEQDNLVERFRQSSGRLARQWERFYTLSNEFYRQN